MRIGSLAFDAISRARRGRIVSAFTRAANILLDNGCLVALLSTRRPMHPWAVGPVDSTFLTTGMEARITEQEFAVGPTAISFAQAIREELAITPQPDSCFHASSLAHLQEYLATNDPPELNSPQEPITAALRAFSSGADVSALPGLVGLGPGVTPSGDDVLVGLLAGLELASNFDSQAGNLRHRLTAGLAGPLEQRTSLLSAQMLRAACAGHYPEPLVDLANHLTRSATSHEMWCAATQLQAIGHRSGRDMLQGFVSATSAASRLPACAPAALE